MGRIARSFELVGQSYRILMQDKELMVLPLVSGVLVAAVAVSFFFGFDLEARLATRDNSLMVVPAFLMYFVTYAIGIFFQAAIVAGATERMRGGDPTLGSALTAAGRRIGPRQGGLHWQDRGRTRRRRLVTRDVLHRSRAGVGGSLRG